MFFLGNDFINHIPSINLRYNGYDFMVNTYKELQKEYGGYFHLIDRSLPDLICFTFLKEYLRKLSKRTILYQQNDGKRKYQQLKIENQYRHEYNQLNQFMKDKKLNIQNINVFLQNKEDNYKEMINHLPLLMRDKEEIKINNLNNENGLSKDYFESLLWTISLLFQSVL